MRRCPRQRATGAPYGAWHLRGRAGACCRVARSPGGWCREMDACSVPVRTRPTGPPSRQERTMTGDQVTAGELQGIARFKIHEGKLEEFKRLSAQCMEIVRTKDAGTLQYETYFNDDQSECMVLERYRDSGALIEHAAHIGDDLM